MNKWKIIFFLVALLVVSSVFAAEIIYPPVTAPGSGGGNNFNPSQFTTNSSQVTIKNGAYVTNLYWAGKLGVATGDVFRIGNNAGLNYTNSIQSIFIGNNAGMYGTNAYDAVFIGGQAGLVGEKSYYSVMIGSYAGYNNKNGFGNVFIGSHSGRDSDNVTYSQFIGTYAGYYAVNAGYSQFIGCSAGMYAVNASKSQFIGHAAGSNATNSSNSINIGYQAGYSVSMPYNLIIDPSDTDNGTNALIFGIGHATNKFITINGNLNVSNVFTLRDNGATLTVNPPTGIYAKAYGTDLIYRRTNSTRVEYLTHWTTNSFLSAYVDNNTYATNWLSFPTAGRYLITVSGTVSSYPNTDSTVISQCVLFKNPASPIYIGPMASVSAVYSSNNVGYLYYDSVNLVQLIDVGSDELDQYWYLAFGVYDGYGSATWDVRITIIRIL
jgi:hypothetical protein